MTFRFRCRTCDAVHQGLPSFAPVAPDAWHGIALPERAGRGHLGSDDCVIDDTYFFVRACLDLAIQNSAEVFSWGVWCSLSAASYARFAALVHAPRRSQVEPLFSYLSNELPFYRGSLGLAGAVHLRNDFLRPMFVPSDSGHPVAVDARFGITQHEAETMASALLHPD